MGDASNTAGRSAVLDLVGSWALRATSPGFFDMPRVDTAELSFSESTPYSVTLEVDFLRNGREHHISGLIDTRPTKEGYYRWRGRGARFIVARGRWAVRVSADRQLAMLTYPGTWLSDGGSLLIAKTDIAANAVEPMTVLRRAELDLTPLEVTTLSWR